MNEQMQPTEGVQGLQGFRHATDGSWDGRSKLRTLCGASISPNFRDVPLRKSKITCPRCKVILKKLVTTSPLTINST